MRCEEFEAQVSELVDDALPSSISALMRAHAATCAPCGELALEIAAIVRDAGALQTLTPSRDLWPGVVARLEAPIVALGTASRTGVHPASRPHSRTASHTACGAVIPRHFFSLRALAAAAVLLVTVSSGATYVLMQASATSVSGAPMASAPMASAPMASLPTAGAPSVSSLAATASASAVAAGAALPGAPEPARSSNRNGSVAEASNQEGMASGSARTAASVASSVASPGASSPAGGLAASSASGRPTRYASNAGTITERAYQREITAMRRIVDERLGDLDSATVVEIERNLRIIDKAIDDSRRALANDPRSRFLSTQLDRALESKLGVLRRIALL